MTRSVKGGDSAMLRKSYYLTLGIPPNESAAGIRQAFRQIVKRYHPDRVGHDRLRFFQEIVQAYHVLGDPERRLHYDQGLSHADAGDARSQESLLGECGGTENLPQSIPVLRAVQIKDAPFEAALALVSGTLTAQHPSREYCQGLNATVVLSPEEASHGGVVWLSVPSCSPCERCGGSGREGVFPCTLCDGEGLIEEQEKVRVLVPAMVPDGTVMNLPLRGLGVHNFYLRLQIRVAYRGAGAAANATA
jgi:molecular chaperone DnaJ